MKICFALIKLTNEKFLSSTATRVAWKIFFSSWRRNKRKNVSHRRLENFQKTELKNSILLQLLCKNIQALKDEFEKNNVK